ncbi:MAG: polysaccharide deacetylase family protein [Myxococcaceae bacterium]
MMRNLLRSAVLKAVDALPDDGVRHELGKVLSGKRLALCLHRVNTLHRPHDFFPEMSIAPDKLDALIEFLLSARKGDGRWLTVSFDDGYLDAAEYIRSRAPRYPELEWIFAICPEKTKEQAGFRWDRAEQLRERGSEVRISEVMEAPFELERENSALTQVDPRFALAPVELCRELAGMPNVALANHTNCHAELAKLPPELASEELRHSHDEFTALFGAPRHFAFPFGIPGVSFTDAHVRQLRELGVETIWSTEVRPYDQRERDAGAVLPRVPVWGNRSVRQIASLIALHAVAANVARGARSVLTASRTDPTNTVRP